MQIREKIQFFCEQNVPKTLPKDERDRMIDYTIKMYSDPDKIMEYAKDDIYKKEFWERISYQTSAATNCFINGKIDVDRFISTPLDEVTKLKISDFEKAARGKGKINLGSFFNPKIYKVTKGKADRYLWLASRLGKATRTKGNAPGLERIPIFNITNQN